MTTGFQTPNEICDLMAMMLPSKAGSILEPTAGIGNLVKKLKPLGNVMAPKDFYKMKPRRFDWVVMNPPFTPMKKGYDILYRCMEMSDKIIALMPWLTIINSERRTNDIMNFGLKSITHLPRNIFKGSRVQTCILEMRKGFIGETIFNHYKK